MSIIETLTEGIVQRDMRKEGEALLNKWSQTGLLEGLTDERQRASMARLLENQAKELLRESSSMAGGDVEGFAAVAFPIVRRVFAGLIANDLVSVQPMSLPSGLIFFLDFTFSAEIGATTQTGRFGNEDANSIYGGNKVGKGIADGVSLVGAMGQDLSGPRTVGGNGYAYGSAKGQSTNQASGLANTAVTSLIKLDGQANMTETQQSMLDYDPDLLNETAMAVIVLDVVESAFAQPDFDNLAAWTITDIMDQANTTGLVGDLNANANIAAISAIANLSLARRLTKRVSSDDRGAPFQSGLTAQAAAVRFFILCDEPAQITESNTATVVGAALPANTISFPEVDDITAGGATGSVIGQATWELENQTEIPEIDIKVDSLAITAQTKKLKAKWTPELGQDLNAYHNLDAEVELTSILSEQVALEIDREIIADLVNGATAGTYYWSRSPGLFVNRLTGAELGAAAAAPDFTGTVSEWYETLIETINDVSAQIHRKTLRGGANFVVCGPEVANILEFTAGFRASVTADADKGDIGAVKVGSLSRKFDVIVDPYFFRNVLLVGRRGASFLESGYVYAPYVPLQVTPTIFGVEDFVPRKGVMTRYGKKMVRPDMYGLVICRGLLGESGST